VKKLVHNDVIHDEIVHNDVIHDEIVHNDVINDERKSVRIDAVKTRESTRVDIHLNQAINHNKSLLFDRCHVCILKN